VETTARGRNAGGIKRRRADQQRELARRLIRRIKYEEPVEEPEDWELYDLERAWMLWVLLDSIEWRWPADVVERQDERLMHDLATISWLHSRLTKQIARDKSASEGVGNYAS
jgi:hypothetical protein